MTETTENGKISYTFVVVRPFADFDGPRTSNGPRSKIVESEGNYKPEYALPIPQTDEDALKFYGKTRDQLLEAGVVQHFYGIDETLKTFWAESIKRENMDVKDLVEAGVIPGDALFVKAPAERKASEAKKTKEVMAEAGIASADDLKAQLAELKALKEQMASKKSKK